MMTGNATSPSSWKRFAPHFQIKKLRTTQSGIQTLPANPYIQRQIDAADWYNLERGATDKGLKDGTEQIRLRDIPGLYRFHTESRSQCDPHGLR